MIQPGTIDQARTLAQQRWAARFAFDLDPAMWDVLFEEYTPGEVLQGIRQLQRMRSQRPDVIYQHLLYALDKLHSQNTTT